MAILIVEDNPVNTKLLQLMLEQHGYETVSARHGVEALAKLVAHVAIDLIITDFMMPEMDGLELIEKVRALPTFKETPIIMASAHSELAIVTKAKGLGCDGFIVKPIDKKQLIKRVEQHLKTSPLILRDKNYIMNKLNMESADYDSLASMFAAQLAAIAPNVVLEQGDSDEPVSEHLGQLLKELAESAAILGADKFMQLSMKFRGGNLPTRAQCPVILRSLQELERALMVYVKPVAKTDVVN